MRKILQNKPLVEAIFELRWQLQEQPDGTKIDPYYKLLIGSIYDKIKGDYSFHEPLPSASIPDELVGYSVQHRFRKDKDEWPLIQVGPGVITLNDTDSYVWEDFDERIKRLLTTFFDTYPDRENLKIITLQLRYIDAIEFDYDSNIFDFLNSHMKTSVSLYDKLFSETEVNSLPSGFDLSFAYSAARPKGTIHLRFRKGKKEKEDALIWETVVQSLPDETPNKNADIVNWVTEAHELTDDWFFKIIEGELLRRFE